MVKAINFGYHDANIYRMTPIGLRIFGRRKELGMRQAELAALVGVTQSMISDYESKGVMFDADKLQALAEALKTTMDYIMYGEGEIDKDEAMLIGYFRAMAPELRGALVKSASAFAAVPPKSVVTKARSTMANRKAA